LNTPVKNGSAATGKSSRLLTSGYPPDQVKKPVGDNESFNSIRVIMLITKTSTPFYKEG
jgi:hypothetical protein